MATVRNIAIYLAVSVLLMTVAKSTTYTVGDADGWSTGVDYNTWVSGKSFKVGDILLFKYLAGEHDVRHVTEYQYNNCKTSRPLKYHRGNGTSIVELTSVGKMHFICGKVDHCGQGMKLLVNIAGSSYSDYSPPSWQERASNSAHSFSSAGYLTLTFLVVMLAAI